MMGLSGKGFLWFGEAVMVGFPILPSDIVQNLETTP